MGKENEDADLEKFEVKYGAAVVMVSEWADGKFALRWREGGKWKRSSATNRVRAVERAKEIARSADQSQGGRVVSVDEHELLLKFKEACGDESPYEVVDLIGRMLRSGSLAEVRDLIEEREEVVSEMRVMDAYDKFISGYSVKDQGQSHDTIRRRLKKPLESISQLCVHEITREMVRGFVEADTATYHNNKLRYWRSFMNFCRESEWISIDKKTVAELVKMKKVGDVTPGIFTVDEASDILDMLRDEFPELVAFFAIACWAGLRPEAELNKLRWEHINWDEGLIHVDSDVAGKTMKERWVPLHPNLATILKPYRKVAGLIKVNKASYYVSALARGYRPKNGKLSYLRKNETRTMHSEKRIVESWVMDVTRHSYISYRLASGVSIGAVAEEAGNSERVIRKSYRKPIKPTVAKKWFEVK